MPSLKNVANFEVQFVWLLAPEGSDTAARVYVRVVFHGAAWGVGGIIKNNSVSQSVTSYGTLRQILLERFPMQGGTSLRRGAAAEAQDVEYALKLARTAASRMPGGARLLCPRRAVFGHAARCICTCTRAGNEHSAPVQTGRFTCTRR